VQRVMSKKMDQSLVDAYASIYEARRGHAAGSSDLEKQASQLASDVRYKAKGRVKEGTNREELKKIYLGLIQSSPAPNVVKQMAKKKLVGESYIPEEGYDIARDMGMVRPSKDKKDATTMPRSNTKREKENLDNKKKGDEALDSVISSLRKKYGKDVVMDMSKKKKKVDEGIVDFIKNPKKTIQNKIDKGLTSATKKLHLGSTAELGSVASPNSGSYKEDYDNRYSDNTGEESKKKKKKLEKKRGMKLDGHPQFTREDKEEKAPRRQKGAMKAYLDKKAEKLQKEKDNQKPEYKNNPAFGDPSHHSNKKMKESVIGEKKLVHGTYGNFVSGQKTDKKSDKPMTADQRRMIPEKMDPVGQEDGDINNDGKKDGTDKYLSSRRKAIGKAIAKKRGRVKEGFSAWRIDLDFQEQVKK